MSEELVDIRTQRIEKINKLKAKGINPYPLRFAKENDIAQVLADFNEEKPQNVSIAGRIKSKREMGKATFCNVEDMSGNIQLYVAADKLGESEYEDFKSFDLGDIVGVKGETFRTKRGEISIKTESMVLLSKCLRPLPVVKEKDGKIFDEFADKETKYRQRYIDLIVNHKTKEDFIMRSRIVSG
ncbi:MAG TPA: OB-fold nucleic acid binding domain-containing protein, partial [Spirochaetota bacterium]|nr:OB-fold nucleic acid binding domain-containing protein [Spirochaetota bacterium]